MPPPRNIEAHKPYLDIWQRALDSPKGISITCASRPDAISFRLRLSQARAAQRQHLKGIYPLGHPHHGLSYFESLTTRIAPDPWRVLIFPVAAITREIAEL